MSWFPWSAGWAFFAVNVAGLWLNGRNLRMNRKSIKLNQETADNLAESRRLLIKSMLPANKNARPND